MQNLEVWVAAARDWPAVCVSASSARQAVQEFVVQTLLGFHSRPSLSGAFHSTGGRASLGRSSGGSSILFLSRPRSRSVR